MRKRVAYYGVATVAAAGLVFAATAAQQGSNQRASGYGMMQGRTGSMGRGRRGYYGGMGGMYGMMMNGLQNPAGRSMMMPSVRLDPMNTNGLYNSMMSHMTVNQMGQMMRYMYGAAGAGMMYGGSMANGMMGNGMMGGGMMGMTSGMHNGNMPYGGMHRHATPQQR